MKTLRVPLNEVANIRSLDSQQLPNNHLNGSIFFNVKEIKIIYKKRRPPTTHPPKQGLKRPPKPEEQESTSSKAAQKNIPLPNLYHTPKQINQRKQTNPPKSKLLLPQQL